ncbi:LysE family transporter [Streptomyces gilvifuscus]|uniref:LysE family transporter n=1 Tax=Streptomyces gilvifuscus TaxID=1550617 RepID=A0ABT5FVI4_9ACTN|nr:LysE family transporter [Streptomyces gilvifuscus]MDC2956558.1 LysE family transporter [Streptomyces gilvifuscus]
MSVDLLGFLGVVLVAYVVPGPDFLVVLRSATEHPVKGRAAALGAQAGLCVHMLAAAVGLSVIAARSPVVYDGVKLLGAAYLVHLGIRAVLAARRAAKERRAGRDRTEGVTTPHARSVVGPGAGRWRSGFAPTYSTPRPRCSSSVSCRSSSTAADRRPGRSSSSAFWTC